MQSSNSSDALLMSIFCHPEVASWKGVSNLLGCAVGSPEFGFLANVAKAGAAIEGTEIDMVLEDSFVEAKLTETDFTSKTKSEVEKYRDFATFFHTEISFLRRAMTF